MLILNPSFQGEGQFYAFFAVLYLALYLAVLYLLCLAFQVFSCDIGAYFPILTFFENKPFNSRKIGDILLKHVAIEA